MSGSSHAPKPAVPAPLPFVDTVADSVTEALYDVNDPTTGIGGRATPSAAQSAHAVDDDRQQSHTTLSFAHRLHTSREEIDFPLTRVGRRVTSSVVVTNNDPERTIELDGIDLVDQGIGDFEVHGANVILEPGRSVTVHLSYVPTASGKHAARVRLFEGAGMSTPYIELRGTASETNEQREERVADQRADLDKNPNLPTTFVSQRKVATEAIAAWKDSAKDLIRATSTWTVANWTRFLSETGADFRVAWTEGHVANVVGDFLSGVAAVMSSNPLVEFVASTFTSLIYDALFTHRGNRENEEAVYKAVQRTGNEIEKKQIDVAGVEAAAIAQALAIATTAEHKARTSLELKDIEQVSTWAGREHAATPKAFNTNDRSLYKQLLQSWVLERSANASEATESTNRPAFQAAREKAFGLKSGQDVARPDLFVFQARHEWSRLGIANVAEIDARLSNQVNELVLQAHAASLEGDQVASYVNNMVGQPIRVELKPLNLEATRLALQELGIALTPRDLQRDRLECLLTLGVDGSSVTAKFFNYYIGRHVGIRTP